ncbi:hypothetical protein INT45_012415 [Circinella minor]|uniref:Uncharacterized protein n=1 Tax=Circinella minor TaxID=1195481 RepID=A0A8H7S0M4_9FUNG|nr:hypothetical protein INT45_012415 [Circinella minor]
MPPNKKLKLTYGQAACAYFAVEPTPENRKLCIEKLSMYKDSTLVYTDDPEDALVMSNVKVNCRPLTYKKYLPDALAADYDHDETNAATVAAATTTTIVKDTNEQLSNKTLSNAAFLELMNTVFLPVDPGNDELYTKSNLSFTNIMEKLKRYVPEEIKSPQVLGTWCKNKRANLMTTPSQVVVSDTPGLKKERKRILYMLNENYHEIVADNIQQYISNYSKELQTFRSNGYTVIGYIRKSRPRAKEAEDNRVRLLHLMAQRLRERSHVEKIFVSPQSNSKETLTERDMSRPNIMNKVTGVDGTMQDLVKYVRSQTKICMVVLDYAGLSTDEEDIKKFLCKLIKGLFSEYSSIKKLVVDLIPTTSKVTIYDTTTLLSDPTNLNVFNCRSATVKRSL